MIRDSDPDHERSVHMDGYLPTDGQMVQLSMNHVRVIRDSDPDHGKTINDIPAK